jgi:RNA polymerase sigma factor (sigma-70 family)
MDASIDKVIRENEGLVHWFLKSHSERDDYEDLCQIARVGVWKAIKTFDESKGSFSTWACQWMRGEVNRYLSAGKRKKRAFVTVSLDAPIGEDGDDTFSNFLADNREDVEGAVTRKLEQERLLSFVRRPRDRQALQARCEGYTLEETAKLMGNDITRERVRQITLRALNDITMGDRGTQKRYAAMQGRLESVDGLAKPNTKAFYKTKRKPLYHRPRRKCSPSSSQCSST